LIVVVVGSDDCGVAVGFGQISLLGTFLMFVLFGVQYLRSILIFAMPRFAGWLLS